MDLSLRNIRKNIAAFSLLALIASFLVIGSVSAAAVDVYGDVSASDWYVDNVDWGLDNGILDSEQAFFRGGDNASRAEFFKMTAAGAGIPEAACNETLFPDMDADHWACGWVTALAEAGIVSGDGASSPTPGYVRPNDNVLRAEAAKVAVESYGLIGTSMGSDVFSDVDAGIWFDEYFGIAYDNCVFQGSGGGTSVLPGTNIVRAEAIAVVNRGAEPTSDCQSVVLPAGALTVNMDSSTPDSSLIPFNANSVLFGVWGFGASNQEAIEVQELTLSRVGLGFPEDFDEVRLYVNGVQQGSKKNVNTTTNQAVFALTGDPLLVPAGGTLLVEGVADMSGQFNSENALCIASPDDVYAVGVDSGAQVSVGGSFAACSEYMYTTSAEVGDLAYTMTDFGGDINVGDMDVDMLRVRIEVDGEDGTMQRLTVKQTGSADPGDFANTMWYQNNVPVEGLDCLWDEDYYRCDFTGADLTVVDGGVTNLDLRTDVVGGIGNTAAFAIHRDTDIFALGGQLGYGLNTTDDSAAGAVVARDIVGGRLAFALSPNNPTVGDVAPNADDHFFMAMNISTAGDAVDITQFQLDVTYVNALSGAGPGFAAVDDLKVWKWNAGTESWQVAASSVDPATGTCPAYAGGAVCNVVFEDIISLPASGTTEFMISMDLDGDTVDGDEFFVTLSNASFEAEYTVDDDAVLPGDISGLPLAGNPQTTAPPSLTANVSSSPGAQTVVTNQADIDLLGLDLTASTASDLILRTLEIECNVTAGGGNCDDFFTGLEMYQRDGASMFFLDDGTLTTGNAVFNNMNFDIASGQTEKVLLRGTATSTPGFGDRVAFEVQDDLNLSVDDSFGFALAAAQLDVCLAVTADQCLFADGESPEITFADNGTIKIAIEDTLEDDIILDGTQGVLVAEITVRETSDSESVKIRELRLTNDVNAPGACASAGGVATVSIPYPDADNPYTAALQSVGGIAEFSFETTGDRAIVIPRDGTVVLPIEVDTNTIGAGGAVSGDCVNLALVDVNGSDYDELYTNDNATDADIEAVGSSSGVLLQNADMTTGAGYTAGEVYNVAGANAEVFTVRNNRPTITTNFELSNGQDLYGFGQTPSTTDPVLGFNVSVEGTDTMTMYDIVVGENGSGACILTANSLLLYREAAYLNVDPALTNVQAATDHIFEMLEFTSSVGLQVVGGNSDDFVVVGDTTACGFDVNTPETLEMNITGFGWDDGKATALPIPATGVTNDTINADTTLIFG